MQFSTSVGQFQILEFIPNTAGYYALLKEGETIYATKFSYFVVLNYYYASPDDALLMTVPVPAKDFLSPTALIESFIGVCSVVPENISIRDDVGFSYFLDEEAIAQFKLQFNIE